MSCKAGLTEEFGTRGVPEPEYEVSGFLCGSL